MIHRVSELTWRGLGVCVLVGLVTAAIVTAARAPQFRDHIARQTLSEIQAWADGTPVPAFPGIPAWGERESSCGIFHWTHHPLLSSYLSVIAVRLGLSPDVVPVGGMLLCTTLVLFVIGIRRFWPAAVVAAMLIAAVTWVPGIAMWVSFPVEHSWAVSCCFLIAAAAASRSTPLFLLAIAWTAWLSIDLVWLHAGMVAASLVAVYGLRARVLVIGMLAIVVYCFENALHLVQNACHFGWDWSLMWQDWFSGLGANTSVAARLDLAMGFTDRLHAAALWLPRYLEAVTTIQDWAHWPFWWAAMACLAVTPVCGRGVLAALIFVAGFCAGFVLVPNLMMNHLHYLPRYCVMLPLGVSVLMSLSWVESR